MGLDDLLAKLERQAGTSGTSGFPADVPAKPAPALGGTSGTSGTAENTEVEAQAETSLFWLLTIPGRNQVVIRVLPAMTLAEVLAVHRTAQSAELIDEPSALDLLLDGLPDDPEPDDAAQAVPVALVAKSCRSCRHACRPGKLTTHCGGERKDLPHSYGPEHPLRSLPADGGRACAVWREAR